MNLKLLARPEFVVFTTRDYALANRISTSSASRSLARLAQQSVLTQVTRGVWANTSHPYFNVLACVPFLLRNEAGYVSFLTALHRHDIISQIPATIQVATTGHTRISKTPVGQFDFIRLKPELMKEGITWLDIPCPYPIATAEKALFDTLYISTRKNRRFSALPELDLAPGLFDSRQFRLLVENSMTSSRIKSAIVKYAEKLGI